jgi:isopentenyldiphosphate isomerase
MSAADEPVDVVDAADAVIGRATRAEVRAGNLRHRATYVLVFNGAGQLFVHQRTAGKDVYPGYFDVAVGGVVTAGETYDEAARRELEEELGISGVPLRRVMRSAYEDQHNRVNGMIYSCTHDGPVTLQATEIASGEWLDLDVVLERIQREPFCPDGVDALCRYIDRLESARTRLRS